VAHRPHSQFPVRPAACQFKRARQRQAILKPGSESERTRALRAFPGRRGINTGPLDHSLVIRRHELRVLYARTRYDELAAAVEPEQIETAVAA
jgi:hypothetical protein